MDEKEYKAILKAIGSYTKKATKSKTTARQTLIREGIYRKDGSLAPPYKNIKKTA